MVCDGLTYPRVACCFCLGGAILSSTRDEMAANLKNCREARLMEGVIRREVEEEEEGKGNSHDERGQL